MQTTTTHVAPILRAEREAAIREALDTAGFTYGRVSTTNLAGPIITFVHTGRRDPIAHAAVVRALGWDSTVVKIVADMVVVETNR